MRIAFGLQRSSQVGGTSLIEAPTAADEGETPLITSPGTVDGLTLQLHDISTLPPTLIADDVEFPYVATYSTGLSPGQRLLKWTNKNNASFTSPIVSVTVTPASPVLEEPESGEVVIGETITFTAVGNDFNPSFDDNTVRIDFYLGGALVASATSAPWTADYVTESTGDDLEVVAVRTWQSIAGETGTTVSQETVLIDIVASPSISPLTLWGPSGTVRTNALRVWRRSDVVSVSSGVVDNWPDLSGNNHDANIQTGGQRPTYVSSEATILGYGVIQTDGAATYWRNNSLALPAPATTSYARILIMRFLTFPATARGFLCQAAATSNRGELRSGTSPIVAQSNGSTVNNNGTGSTSAWQSIIAQFTGSTSDAVKISTAARVTGGNAGNNTGTGEIGGKNAGSGTVYTHMECAETLIVDGFDSTPGSADMVALKSYYDSYYPGMNFL